MNGSVYLAVACVTINCYRKLRKVKTPWYCKICIRQVILFSNLTDHQLEALLLDKLFTSPKLISNNQLPR